MGHYIENTGDTRLRILIGFNAGNYEEISLSTWLASNPDDLADHFKMPDALVKAAGPTGLSGAEGRAEEIDSAGLRLRSPQRQQGHHSSAARSASKGPCSRCGLRIVSVAPR